MALVDPFELDLRLAGKQGRILELLVDEIRDVVVVVGSPCCWRRRTSGSSGLRGCEGSSQDLVWFTQAIGFDLENWVRFAKKLAGASSLANGRRRRVRARVTWRSIATKCCSCSGVAVARSVVASLSCGPSGQKWDRLRDPNSFYCKLSLSSFLALREAADRSVSARCGTALVAVEANEFGHDAPRRFCRARWLASRQHRQPVDRTFWLCLA
jgi:hypothetical protein